MSVTLTVTDVPADEDVETIRSELSAFNDADVGPASRSVLAVVAREDGGAVVAGIYGYTAWGWLYIQWLWVAESLRGQRIAAQMLEAAEIEARRRGCRGAWIDTFNPVALKVYRAAGYEVFGELADFPVGRTRTFLQKTL